MQICIEPKKRLPGTIKAVRTPRKSREKWRSENFMWVQDCSLEVKAAEQCQRGSMVLWMLTIAKQCSCGCEGDVPTPRRCPGPWSCASCTFREGLHFPVGWILAWKFAGTPPGWVGLLWCHLEHAKDVGELLRGPQVTVGDKGNCGKHGLQRVHGARVEPPKMKSTSLDKAQTTGNTWLE